jgi:ABC-type iron transport system FetAB ATPase subunit
MNSNKTPNKSILEVNDGPFVVSIINRVFDSLDAAALSTEEALLINMVMSRAIAALWHHHSDAMVVLHSRKLATLLAEEDTESDDGSDNDKN